MRGSFRVPKQVPENGVIPARAPPASSPVAVKQPKVETKMDISLFYQIFPEEILGSGQFGTVYGGVALISRLIAFYLINLVII